MNEWGLLLLVFGFVTALALGLGSLFGADTGRRLRNRLQALADTPEQDQAASAIRARYLRQLTPLERTLEELPGMAVIGRLTEQAGWHIPAYRFALTSLLLAVAGAILGGLIAGSVLIALAAGAILGALPVLKARIDRAKRLELFEAQLPDALDLMSRSLRAGNPLMESFKFVAEEMKPPIAADFGRAWSNVNYGVSLKASLADLLERTPSSSLRSLSTAILVQRETGGNLAEILDKLTNVMRSRQKFQRKVRTLTAEGRASGWVLGGLPFATGAIMAISTPGHINVLFTEPGGRKMIALGLILMAIGGLWITRIIKIRV